MLHLNQKTEEINLQCNNNNNNDYDSNKIFCRSRCWENLRKEDQLEGRRRWEDGIKMDLKSTGRGIDWIYLAQDKDNWLALVKAK
jgi:hypothetical protein